MRAIRALAVVLGITLVAACGGGGDEPEGEPAPSTSAPEATATVTAPPPPSPAEPTDPAQRAGAPEFTELVRLVPVGPVTIVAPSSAAGDLRQLDDPTDTADAIHPAGGRDAREAARRWADAGFVRAVFREDLASPGAEVQVFRTLVLELGSPEQATREAAALIDGLLDRTQLSSREIPVPRTAEGARAALATGDLGSGPFALAYYAIPIGPLVLAYQVLASDEDAIDQDRMRTVITTTRGVGLRACTRNDTC